jgi:hypothetical protein
MRQLSCSPTPFFAGFSRASSMALFGDVPPNNALERSVRGLRAGAAGALESFAPAALSSGVPRPAQRGR